MQVYLFSIAPVWVEKLANGEKKFELRRRGPRDPVKHSHALIYSTAPISAIVAKSIITGAVTGTPTFLWHRIGADSGCTENEFFKYFRGCPVGSAIAMSNVRLLSHPITFNSSCGWRPPVSWRRIYPDHILYEIGSQP
jgi:predicted transcriptional regulator